MAEIMSDLCLIDNFPLSQAVVQPVGMSCSGWIPVSVQLGGRPALGSLHGADGDDGLAYGAQHGARPGRLALVHVRLQTQRKEGSISMLLFKDKLITAAR